MIKLHLMLLMLLRNIRLVLSVPPSLQMRLELKNSLLRKCGSHQMVPSETNSMEQSSENQFSLAISQNLFQDGLNQLLLEDTLLVINIKPLIMLLKVQANSK
jgi:hypothetical protein